VTVESAPGRGSRFEVYLPSGGGAVDAVEPAAAMRTAENGRETVLLVEDDPGVRRLAASALRDRGYTVVEASDGAEAVGLGRELGPSLDVLVSDLVLPGMRAREVVAELRRAHPDLRVLLVSGYMPDERACGPADGFLGKPFFPDELARAVRMVLDAPGLVAVEPPPFLAGQGPL
jgi:two-component system cell cycle sensor histidine kinase/response regulator CckA